MHAAYFTDIGHKAIGNGIECIHGNGHRTILGGCQRQQATEGKLKCQSGNECGNAHLGDDQALCCTDQHTEADFFQTEAFLQSFTVFTDFPGNREGEPLVILTYGRISYEVLRAAAQIFPKEIMFGKGAQNFCTNEEDPENFLTF